MNLYLLRHGLAVEPGATGMNDAERPLTPKGIRKIRKEAEALREMEVSFDVVLSSPLLRARQTAEVVAETLELSKKLECTETLLPAASPSKLVGYLNHLDPPPEEVLLVGHEPSLSDLISLFISGQHGAAVLMKKGGICKLAVEALHAGRCATLEWLLTPKQLALMA